MREYPKRGTPQHTRTGLVTPQGSADDPDMPASFRPSSRAQRLLEHHRMRGRAYPKLTYWDRLYQQLSEEAEKRGKTPPPPPLIHGLEQDPTELDRMERLDEQVVWADRNNLLHRVQMFFDAMPVSAWQPRQQPD